jgi:hypothetical protein
VFPILTNLQTIRSHSANQQCILSYVDPVREHVRVDAFIFSCCKKVFAHGQEVSRPSTCRLGRARRNSWSSVARTVRCDIAEVTDRVKALEMELSCHVLVDGRVFHVAKRRRWQEVDKHRPGGYERVRLSFIKP